MTKTRPSTKHVEALLSPDQRTLMPYTRVFDLGSSFNVSVSEDGVESFARRWPGSGLRSLRGVTFQFDKKSGDLVDVFFKNGNADRWDGPALVALSEDAQAIGQARLGLIGRSFGRAKARSRR